MFTSGLIRYEETAPKETRISIVDITKMSTTPLRSALCSRMRSENSSVKVIFEITSVTEALSRATTRARQDHLVRSGLSSADCTSLGRREGPKIAISER